MCNVISEYTVQNTCRLFQYVFWYLGLNYELKMNKIFQRRIKHSRT